MKNWTIRAKITLLFIVCMIAVLGCAYGAFFASHETVVRHFLQSDLQETLENDLEQVAWHAGDGVPDPVNGLLFLAGSGGYLEIDEDFIDLMNGMGIGLFDGEGRLLYGKDLIPDESASLPFSDGKCVTIRSGPDVFYVYDRRLAGGQAGDFWLRGAVDREQRREEVSQVLRISLFLLPLLIAMAAGGGYLITRRSLRPMRLLTETAGSISSGSDLKQRIRIDAGPRNEIRSLADSFNAMIQRLEASFEAEKRFTADVSHELRTPMATILAQCELALEGDDLAAEEARHALEVIRRQGDRMNDLIEDMLTYTRIERQHQRYPLGPLDLAALVREGCSAFLQMHGQDLPLQVDIGRGDHRVNGSETLLLRLLQNLLENAVRYGKPDGTIRVELNQESADGEDQLLLRVADDGEGIAPEHLPHIFERFYQANPARSGEGTGLGLAMVKEIAGLHGGSVQVASSPGEGSIFTVQLPALASNKKT